MSLKGIGLRWHNVSSGKNDKGPIYCYFLYFRYHWKLNKHNVKGKLHRGDWVYPPGTDRPSWVVICLFVVFLVIYQITVVSNVSMILLIRTDSKLQPPFLCRFLLCHHCHSSDAGSFLMQEENHFLPWLLYTVPLFHCLGDCRLLHAHSDGLRSLCGHLQTIVIWQQDVPRCLPFSCCCSLFLWLCK